MAQSNPSGECLTVPPCNAEDQLRCDAEINDIHKEINSQQLEIDKQLLTLSSALIALSLAFAKEVAKKYPTLLPLLILGLLLVAACILIVLFSFRWSITGLEKAKDYWSARQLDTYGTHAFPLSHAQWIKRINGLSYVFFASGFCCIAIFVATNISREIALSKDLVRLPNQKMPLLAPHPDITTGTTIKIPSPPPQTSPKK